MENLKRILRLQPGEGSLVFILGCVLFANALAQQVSEITAISNFLSEGGVNSILIVWAFDSAIIFGMTAIQSLIVDRFDRLTLIKGVLICLAGAFLLLRLLFVFGAPAGLNYALLYLLSEQQYLFFPLVFWILANDTFTLSQATRLFPLIAAADFVGRLTGIGITTGIAQMMSHGATFKPQELLDLNAMLYLLIFALVSVGLRHVKVRKTLQPKETVRETLTEGMAFVRDVPAFRFIALAIALLLICDTIIEFRFLGATEARFTDPAQYQTFYSLYRLGVTLLIILVQSLFTSRILTSLALKNIFIIKPLSLVAAIVGMLVAPGIVSAVFAMVLLKLSSATIDDPSRKTFQSLVPEERRGRVSIFMDSYLYCIGSILGCLFAGIVVIAGSLSSNAWFSANSFYIYLGIALLAAILAALAILKMRTVYDASLLNWRLKRRQRTSSVLDRLQI